MQEVAQPDALAQAAYADNDQGRQARLKAFSAAYCLYFMTAHSHHGWAALFCLHLAFYCS